MDEAKQSRLFGAGGVWGMRVRVVGGEGLIRPLVSARTFDVAPVRHAVVGAVERASPLLGISDMEMAACVTDWPALAASGLVGVKLSE